MRDLMILRLLQKAAFTNLKGGTTQSFRYAQRRYAGRRFALRSLIDNWILQRSHFPAVYLKFLVL